MKIKKGIYIVPNLFTTGNIFCGFYSIVSVINKNFYHAAWAILVATIFDALDGRVARWTHATSDFGVQYDSLSDLVSFGMAPALLVYMWVLQPFGRIGWLAAFLFVICAALRLARFNTHAAEDEGHSFEGLPTPAAAIMVASTVIMTKDLLLMDKIHPLISVMVVYSLAFLMVSSVKYRSFKHLELTKKKSFSILLFAILLIYIIVAMPELFIFLIISAYVIDGPLEWLLFHRKEAIESNKVVEKHIHR
ncbi:MAG: CDP-diacylglycerol--serine O-phosphatidyltransferase [Nitrospinota bacterium]